MDEDKKENNDCLVESDPDYETTNSPSSEVTVKEEDEDADVSKQTNYKKIIADEFDRELRVREKGLEELENKITNAQKLMHVLRYAIISSYYNNKGLEVETDDIETAHILTGQNRIHPALKKLLGKNVNDVKFLSRTKRKAATAKAQLDANSSGCKRKTSNKSSDCIEPDLKKIKIEEGTLTETLVRNEEEEPAITRNKVQHRIVIGNTSYCKNRLEQKNSFKWMTYIKIFRGLKEDHEITNLIVSKVIFYLHPTYKPNVVDVSQPPFHLSRKGWGEFPLRVKIYFKFSMNKPVNVVHQLKLNSVFKERQTLGNETIFPIFLYEEESASLTDNSKYTEKSSDSGFVNEDLQDLLNPHALFNNELFNVDLVKEEPVDSHEHDYCHDNPNLNSITERNHNSLGKSSSSKSLVYSVHDHSYSVSSEKEGQKSPKKHKSPTKQPYNELIYGLGPNYLDGSRKKTRTVRAIKTESPEKASKSSFKVLKTVTGQSIRCLPESFNQVLQNSGNIVSVKFISSHPSTTINGSFSHGNLNSTNGNTLTKQTKQLLKPPASFKCMGEALPYLFKRLPLWTSEAADFDYKYAFPFTANSETEYRSWNVGKKLSAEWCRAKAIRRILANESYSENWNTKAIFMYGRSHLYPPLVRKFGLFNRSSMEKELILRCFQHDRVSNGHSNFGSHESDTDVCITSPIKGQNSNNSIGVVLDISEKTQECVFIKEAALDVGVLLKPEVIEEGVAINAAEQVMLEAVKCFAEQLVRRSANFLVCQGNFRKEPAIVTTKEIRKSLAERQEFKSITAFSEKRFITNNFFS